MRTRGYYLLASMLCVAAVFGAYAPSEANRNALWERVQRCAAEPKPPYGTCLVHNKPHKFVVLKDGAPGKTRAYLLSPDFKVPGIEAPDVFVLPVLNFWKFGWDEATALVKEPPYRLGLAINSAVGRSQDQLHIHLSCATPKAIAALEGAHLTQHFQAAPFVKIGSRTYNARIADALADKDSPFKLILEIAGAKEHMRDQTIAVIGARHGGYYIVQDFAHGSDKGTAEALLDESCT
jgi:CDP-diacylglycerol pyrophosphatase